MSVQYGRVDRVVSKATDERIPEWSGIIQWCEGYLGSYEEPLPGEVSCHALRLSRENHFLFKVHAQVHHVHYNYILSNFVGRRSCVN